MIFGRQLVIGCATALLALLPARGLAQAEGPSALREAAEAIAAGDLQKADVALDAILKTSPNDVRALDLLGILRAQQHREVEAEKLFQHAIAEDAHFTSAYVHMGLLYTQMGRPEDAATKFREALRLDSSRSDASTALVGIVRQQARDALTSGDNEKALAFLIEARKYAPDNPDVQFEFGMVALRMSLLPDAIQGFQETLKLRKNDSNAVYGLGRAFLAQSNFESAAQEFSRYLELRPDDASAHYAMGMALSSLERFPDARAQYEKSIALKPEQTESYFRLGLLDLEGKDFNSACERFRHVIQRDPQHAGALAALGKAEFLLKNYSDASGLLERAVASDQSLREAHYYLGLTYARMGRKQESDEQLQIATRLEHEETEHDRTVYKILDPGSGGSAAPK